jgi:hypothetical protein
MPLGSVPIFTFGSTGNTVAGYGAAPALFAAGFDCCAWPGTAMMREMARKWTSERKELDML